MVSTAIGAAFGDHRDDRLAADILRAAYLSDGASHEAIARRFHLSRSAYFRRLQAATTRLGAELGPLVRREMGRHRY
jgi:DNA invertase Pin-like site-specific DNA recombinase